LKFKVLNFFFHGSMDLSQWLVYVSASVSNFHLKENRGRDWEGEKERE
jgi:hypothetical protein